MFDTIGLVNPIKTCHEPAALLPHRLRALGNCITDISSIAGLANRIALIRKKGSCSTLFSINDKPERVLTSHCEECRSTTNPKNHNNTRTSSVGIAMTRWMAKPAAIANNACL